MPTYLVMIWLSATPAIWSGGYMTIPEGMGYCREVAQHMAADPLNEMIPTTYFCSQDLIDPRMIKEKHND